ncbi:beta-1,6-N-acetylglucosaminyltransferase [Mobilicoccus sp.]|uniref:beta-1,6-N-acetylglucosaminyltransferase n=1 Tax=Mobilicoccus sp. TaxID=2034349 RepID=UPI0028B1027D|nr:beta-1,6-N-acetylglucosaminyltransferase [Mobilicoccus sp.]
MSACYVVLAHTDPDGLVRLVRRIRALSPEADVVVRFDARDLVSPEALRAEGAIPLQSRLPVRWGDWSLVDAAREALSFALRESDADWFSVISGQDYPVRDLAAWEEGLQAGHADVVLDPMPAKPQTWEYTWSSFVVRVPGPPLLERLASGVVSRGSRLLSPWVDIYRLDRTGPRHYWVRRPRRDAARPPFLVKASQWMTVRRPTLTAALDELATGSERVDFLRTVLVPDEIALQSLCTAHADTVREAPTTAAHFAPEAPSPDWLTPALVRELAATGAPFVRKMPAGADPQILEVADALAEAPTRTMVDPVAEHGTGRTEVEGGHARGLP